MHGIRRDATGGDSVHPVRGLLILAIDSERIAWLRIRPPPSQLGESVRFHPLAGGSKTAGSMTKFSSGIREGATTAVGARDEVSSVLPEQARIKIPATPAD